MKIIYQSIWIELPYPVVTIVDFRSSESLNAHAEIALEAVIEEEKAAECLNQNAENQTIKASVYSRICYEKATDVQEETFPWDEEGIARMRQWLQANYEAFCRREGIPEAAE